MKIKRSVVFFIGLILGIFITSVYVLPNFEAPVKISGDSIDSVPTQSAVAVNDRDYFPITSEVLQNADDSIHMIEFELKYYPTYPNSNEMDLLRDLVNAADRGVEVKIVTDQFYTNDAAVQFLKQNGVNIKYDSSKITTHSKLIIIDGEIVMIGSTNWSYYSIDKNHESNVLIRSKELAEEFESYFMEIWNES